MGGLNRLIKGDPAEATRKEYQPMVDAVNRLADSMAVLDNQGLRARTAELQKRARGGESLNDLLPEAFAVKSRTLPAPLLPRIRAVTPPPAICSSSARLRTASSASAPSTRS